MKRTNIWLQIFLMLATAHLAACGLKGPLTLPKPAPTPNSTPRSDNPTQPTPPKPTP
ncbi:MAG: lipoprotein [Betaproteobacteria bacterium]|nr:lipoprotein [Betaproteobacteria bacterium]MDE2621751.1 lipoprotein [Betaproteobacteria bacterium]